MKAAEAYYNKINGLINYGKEKLFLPDYGKNIIDEVISYIGIPKKFIEKSFKDYDDIENIDIDWDNLKDKSYYFTGKPGTGKTFLVSIMAKVITINNIGFEKFIVRFIDEPSFFQRLTRDRNNSQQAIDYILKSDYIIYDELGGDSRNTEFIISTRYYIINEIYKREIPVIFTSNLNLNTLMDSLGSPGLRIVDRIIEMCKGIEFTGSSKR